MEALGLNPATKNRSHPKREVKKERAEINEAKQLSSRSSPELRAEGSRVSALKVSTVKHHW